MGLSIGASQTNLAIGAAQAAASTDFPQTELVDGTATAVSGLGVSVSCSASSTGSAQSLADATASSSAGASATSVSSVALEITEVSSGSATAVHGVSSSVTGQASGSSTASSTASVDVSASVGGTATATSSTLTGQTVTGVAMSTATVVFGGLDVAISSSTSSTATAHLTGPLAEAEVVPNTIGDAENAMRVRAYEWAQANGLLFVFDNAAGHDPTLDPTQTTLLWCFRPGQRERLTGGLVEHRGTCMAKIIEPTLPASGYSGNPFSDRLALAQSLVDHFRGQRDLGGACILDESSVRTIQAPLPTTAVEASIEWEFAEEVSSGGYIGTPNGSLSVGAYNAWRDIWSGLSLNVTTYFDGVPAGLAIELPAAVCSFSVSPGVPVSMHTTMHNGRVSVGLHYELETGVQLAQQDVQAISSAFDSVSVGGVSFRVPETTVVGRTAGGTWQVNVRLPFVFQDIFTS